MNKTVSNFLLGFLAGAAAGALMGVLLAPDKGSKTRQNFKKKVREFSDEYGLGLGEMMDEADMETEQEEKEEPETNPPSVKRRKFSRKSKSSAD
jgi:gas vesicle protein